MEEMMKVRDIMTTDVTAMPPTCTIAEVAQAMRRLDVGSIPLVDNSRLVGVITDRDIAIRVVADGLDPHLEAAESHMTSSPITIAPDTSSEEAAQIMAREQIRRLPVVENGNLIGYLALGDLAAQNKDRQVGETLEEISEPSKPQSGARSADR
jgi:CBS domain-containing protein